MYRYFASIRNGRGSSLAPLLPSFGALPSHRFLRARQNDGHIRGFSSASWGLSGRNPSENVNANANANENTRPDFMQDRENINSRSWGLRGRNPSENVNATTNARPDFMRDRENINSRSWGLRGRNPNENVNANASARPDFMQDRENINPRSENNAEISGNFRHMDYVRGVIEEDGKGFMGGSIYPQYHYEQDADFVHIKMLRNNTFVTVTDPKGNIKLSGSAGSLKEMKSGQKLSRYAAEATAEVVGRRARGLGLKSVVMKVKGFTHFRRKRQAIMSWREGFTDSRGDKNPIVFIEDTTRRPHNGCRLPKKRRI